MASLVPNGQSVSPPHICHIQNSISLHTHVGVLIAVYSLQIDAN